MWDVSETRPNRTLDTRPALASRCRSVSGSHSRNSRTDGCPGDALEIWQEHSGGSDTAYEYFLEAPEKNIVHSDLLSVV